MTQTKPDIEVTSEWQSVNTLAGITVGDAMVIDNKSLLDLLLAEGTEPTSDSFDGVPMTSMTGTKSTKVIPAGSLEIWVRVLARDLTTVAKASVQEA